MYCPVCNCEYTGWSAGCPGCTSGYGTGASRSREDSGTLLPYDDLVRLVREHGGRLEIPLATTQYGRCKKRDFPYFGHGFAWARRIEGIEPGIPVDLQATRVAMQTGKSFPYLGRGYAWVECLEGHLAGNSITLDAGDIARERKWAFPYTGYGRAWTDTMTGTCGDQLQANLKTTAVSRERARTFPYFGFGFGWISEATLTLTLLY